MTFFLVLMFALVGAFLTALSHSHGMTGLFLGGFVGWLFSRTVKQSRRLEQLESSQVELQQQIEIMTHADAMKAKSGDAHKPTSTTPASTRASEPITPKPFEPPTTSAPVTSLEVTNSIDSNDSGVTTAATDRSKWTLEPLAEVNESTTTDPITETADTTRLVTPMQRPSHMPPPPKTQPGDLLADVRAHERAVSQQTGASTADAPSAHASTAEAVEPGETASNKAGPSLAARSISPTRRSAMTAEIEADSVFDRLKRFFTEGNLPAKFGVLVLFFGVAALLKYAADAGWFTFPIEWRLSGIALAAIAALIFAFNKRDSHPGFSLAVQGGAIGILMLTVFAAFRYYHLISQPAAFGMMVLLAGACGLLAVKQNAFALALLGLLGGFLAPILISTGSGSHVALFSYYLILNLVIFAIAFAREWRVLNLLGWLFTFGIGTAWGVMRYQPENFRTTEPFLIAFVVIFTAIAFVYALRAPAARRGFVDGTLTFGTPLVAFLLQTALLEGDRMQLAYSALAMAGFYLLMALLAHARNGLKNLRDSYAGLAIVFATIAVPLALSARATAATWAIEGALLIWLGIRQDHRIQRWSGWLLQLGASASFFFSMIDKPMPKGTQYLLNGEWFGAMLLTGAAFFSARCYKRSNADGLRVGFFFLLALFWWLIGNAHDIELRWPGTGKPEALFVLFALTATLSSFVGKRWAFSLASFVGSMGLLLGLVFVFIFNQAHGHVLGNYAPVAWILFAALSLLNLNALRDRIGEVLPFLHAAWWLTWPLLASFEINHQLIGNSLGSAWELLAMFAPWLLLLGVVLMRRATLALPNFEYAESLHRWLGGALAAVATFALALSLFHNGEASPIQFVPILNPLEMMQIVIVLMLSALIGRGIHSEEGRAAWRNLLWLVGFVLYSMAVLRAVHHFAHLGWNIGLLTKGTAQSALTIAWSVAGIAVMVIAARRVNRTLWYSGWALMLIVLAKLLLIDRNFIGNLSGIVSFMGVGLLLVAVGYFAPAPPKNKTTNDDSQLHDQG